MADCELLDTCLFFNDKLENMPSFAELVKEQYCRGDGRACARYRVFLALGREHVPNDLFPGEIERAETMLARVAD